MVKDNNDLDKKRSTNRHEHILEESINTNEDSQCILKYDQVMQSQPKHEEGGNKDLKHFIKLNSYQNQLSQSELELLRKGIQSYKKKGGEKIRVHKQQMINKLQCTLIKNMNGSMHFTQTAINHRNTVKAEGEHIDPGFLEGTLLKGKTCTEKNQEAKRCTRAYETNNLVRDDLKHTEKKAYVKTERSKYKKINLEQQIKMTKQNLITKKKETATSKRKIMRTINRKEEQVAMRVLPKTRSWGKDEKLRWKRPKAKRFHSQTLERSDWNLNLDRNDVQTESLVREQTI
ncbi:Hypothetical predicted protein [Mytilus galloprovincialis]|uniref:Uncharacterized protein n=1 Tax=Mytilus galloprovincialis TaxID=29158 RepID=A0A8B6CZP0_MYTGA|nr:Hypothetical predicted protein [Mytilus galloprovincialis]